MYIDTHCHVFSEYYDDIEKVISECKDNNVNRIIVNGCDIVSNKEVLELVNKYDIIYGAIGFHPTELDDFNDEYFSFLEENINNSKIVAVGEIGLDYHYDDTDREKQSMVFRKQLDIAQKYDKPIIVHSRDSIQDTYNILKEYNYRIREMAIPMLMIHIGVAIERMLHHNYIKTSRGTDLENTKEYQIAKEFFNRRNNWTDIN